MIANECCRVEGLLGQAIDGQNRHACVHNACVLGSFHITILIVNPQYLFQSLLQIASTILILVHTHEHAPGKHQVPSCLAHLFALSRVPVNEQQLP